MLLRTDEKKSLMIMQIILTATVAVLPAIIGLFSPCTELYILFTAYSAAMILRLKNTEKYVITGFSAVLSALLCYALLSSLWIDNREGHLLYLYGLGTSVIFIEIFCDSFITAVKDSFSRRYKYLLSIGGALCATANIFYWLTAIVPFAKNEKMALGFGNSDFLAVFMLACILITAELLKNSTKLRKGVFCLFLLLTGFVFFMTAGTIVWIMAILFIALCFIKKYYGKFFFAGAVSAAIAFFVFSAFYVLAIDESSCFKEIFNYGIKSFFGKGGGYLSNRELFLNGFSECTSAGVIACFTASSGLFGLIAALLVVALNFISFIKLKDIPCLFSLLLTALVMFLPVGGLCTFLFFIGLSTYNLCSCGAVISRSVRKSGGGEVRKAVSVLLILCFVSVILFASTLFRNYADSLYRDKKYLKAYEYYYAAACVNLTDAQSCHKAAESLRKGGDLSEKSPEAVQLINKAIEREPGNLEHVKEKALIFKECGEFEKAAQQYRYAIRVAVNDDSYNLLLADVLYDAIRLYPKGSVDSREIYSEITSLALNTVDLECKKQINDIADKALTYKKGEIDDAKE